MMRVAVLSLLVGLVGSFGCEPEPASDLDIERLSDVEPSLPPVPEVPPPPHPIEIAPGEYTIYGLRRRMNETINEQVTVTGYIVEVYEPPECPEGETCPAPRAPHFRIADTRGESDREKHLIVTGYAVNHEEVQEAVEAAERGRPIEVNEGEVAIPTDLAVGNKVRIVGQFVYVSGTTGFHGSEGILDFRSHDTLEVVEGS